MLGKSLLLVRFAWRLSQTRVRLPSDATDLRFCYDVLAKVSRSFAVVTAELEPAALRDAVCLFYLVLRALDTIEDDAVLPLPDKKKELYRFSRSLTAPTAAPPVAGEKLLLEGFFHVTAALGRIACEAQRAIATTTAKMADGMIECVGTPRDSVASCDRYCYYVAGLVGHGLVELFACYRTLTLPREPAAAGLRALATEMGLFLQKINLIRDYAEDVRDSPPRCFWPREIWSRYSDTLAQLQSAGPKALDCLDAMLLDALRHWDGVVVFICHTPMTDGVRRFCAIPQLVAFATLARLYRDPAVFTRSVKLPRTETARIFLECHRTEDFIREARAIAEAWRARLAPDAVATAELRRALQTVLDRLAVAEATSSTTQLHPAPSKTPAVALLGKAHFTQRQPGEREKEDGGVSGTPDLAKQRSRAYYVPTVQPRPLVRRWVQYYRALGSMKVPRLFRAVLAFFLPRRPSPAAHQERH